MHNDIERQVGEALGEAMALAIDHDMHHVFSPFTCAGYWVPPRPSLLVRLLGRLFRPGKETKEDKR